MTWVKFEKEIKKMLGTMIYSANSNVRFGIENLFIYLRDKVKIFNARAGELDQPALMAWADFLQTNFSDTQRSKEEKKI